MAYDPVHKLFNYLLDLYDLVKLTFISLLMNSYSRSKELFQFSIYMSLDAIPYDRNTQVMKA